MVGLGGRTRWTPAELRSAQPAVLDAARWELYADRLWPGPDVVASIEADEAPQTKTQIHRRKVAARKQLELIKRALLPPDEPDGER